MRNRYVNKGWLATIFVALLPVILWQIVAPYEWKGAKNIFENIGRLAGLVGMALFAWNVILSARLKIYNKLFLGLDNTYRAHHTIGQVSLILLLIHPVTIAYRYFLSSPLSAYEFIKPNFASPFRALGNFSLFLMIIAMIVTLYINVKYQYFILAQRALGLILFLGGIHAFFVGASDLGSNGVLSLRLYYGLLLLMAAVVYVYRSIFHGNFSKYYDYAISAIKPMGDIYEIELKPNGNALQYQPGQFAFIRLESAGVLGETHPFSMSSSPLSDTLSFGIKKLGDYTTLLSQIKPGQKVKIDGPYGTFSNRIVSNKRQVWIAGGIGVTPFMAMARSMDDSQLVDMYYSVKDKSEAAYLSELNILAQQNPNLKIFPFYSDSQGLLTVEYIQKNSKNLEDANYMICGPGSMMKAMRQQLKNIGVVKRNINTEEFYLG